MFTVSGERNSLDENIRAAVWVQIRVVHWAAAFWNSHDTFPTKWCRIRQNLVDSQPVNTVPALWRTRGFICTVLSRCHHRAARFLVLRVQFESRPRHQQTLLICSVFSFSGFLQSVGWCFNYSITISFKSLKLIIRSQNTAVRSGDSAFKQNVN